MVLVITQNVLTASPVASLKSLSRSFCKLIYVSYGFSITPIVLIGPCIFLARNAEVGCRSSRK